MEFIIPIFILIIAIMGMSLSLFFNRPPLKGSCGGQGGVIKIGDTEMSCPACHGDPDKCENNPKKPDGT